MEAVIVYLDPSVLVSLFIPDALSTRADRVLRIQGPEIVLSDFSAAEFASAVSRRVRTRELKSAEAQSLLSEFDEWCIRTTRHVEITALDVAVAANFLRRLPCLRLGLTRGRATLFPRLH